MIGAHEKRVEYNIADEHERVWINVAFDLDGIRAFANEA